MSDLRQATGVRGPMARRLAPGGVTVPGKAPRRLPRALTATRTLASVLILLSGIFYATVAVKGVSWLLAPPPELVTRANELGSAMPPADAPGAARPWGLGEAAEVLFRPLAVTGAALAGLLLLWAGGRGLGSRRDQRRWRRLQITALGGLAIGVLGFTLGLTATGFSQESYVDASWIGLEPARPSAALALLIAAIALLVPAGAAGRRGADGCPPLTPAARPSPEARTR